MLLKNNNIFTKKKNIVTAGWVESELANHNEALKRFSMQLRNVDKLGVIEWNENCKIYLMHKE